MTCAFSWRRQWHPTPVLLPGKSHGRRSLVGSVHGVARNWIPLSDFTFTFHFPALEKEMATHSSVLAWRMPGTGEPGGCCLWHRTESDTTEVTQQQQQQQATPHGALNLHFYYSVPLNSLPRSPSIKVVSPSFPLASLTWKKTIRG